MSDRSAGDEQRHFHRIPFDAQARLNSEIRSWTSTLVDISLNGALLERPADWSGSPGSRFQLQISLSPDQTVEMQVEVAHVESNRIGFRCAHIDVDSITHLRRLVELNTGDPESLNRELSQLGLH
jgi:hypothetical protein